jgi:ribosomal protein S1
MEEERLTPEPQTAGSAGAAAPELEPEHEPKPEQPSAGFQPAASAEAAEAAETAPVAAAAAPAGEETMPPVPSLRSGDVVDGTVVSVTDDGLLVDFGYKSDGQVPAGELRLPQGRTAAETFAPGQVIPVMVLQIENAEGTPVLSHRRGVEARAWTWLEEANRTGEVVEAPVTAAVKGGLVCDVGLRGFMPASHVERGYVNDLSVYVGQTMRCRVIEIDRAKNRVILSQKVVLEEEHKRMRDRTWATLAEGQVRRGVVKGLTDFGAFVDLGGVDGLLHVSEMAWGRVAHPSDVLQVGDEIDVMILRLDPTREKISLGLKQVLPDPWETVEERYPIGSIHEGKVMRLAAFGAFIQLEPGVEGLVHISQMADYHVHEPGEVVTEGQTVRVKVLRVSPAERRISLSIRDAEHEGPRGGGFQQQWGFSPPQHHREGLTLGDMFGALFEENKDRLQDRDREDR